MIGSVTRFISGLLLLGFFIAVLRAFDWDPFALTEWFWGWTSQIVNATADWFSSLEWFQRIFTKPA